MSERINNGVSFGGCPECGIQVGTRGMARHRKAQHGVAPATTRKAPKPTKTAAQRAAELDAFLAKRAAENAQAAAVQAPKPTLAAPAERWAARRSAAQA